MRKRFVFILLFVFVNFSVSARYEIAKDSVQNRHLILKLDSMGIDNAYILNQYEGEYFNIKLEKEHNCFDFMNKKIAFFTGSNGSVLKDKKDYYTMEKERLLKYSSSNRSYLIIFDEKQKRESGGYDAVIIYWAKMVRENGYYVEKLKKQNKD